MHILRKEKAKVVAKYLKKTHLELYLLHPRYQQKIPMIDKSQGDQTTHRH